ncbi:hypothetical protein MSC49_12950 [Methylosinus sp. C49]|uniref:type II toxin-antitoxin system MqsA family antitoxin n=1 Tax=Methylosinus sp. C49 TaxID=2699395 RepID=UPI0013675C4E|nr:type II toxin-antitoxin system MqsA family antitoxin [Methylosinus sp. C49]BBU61360.1 hypothetical protein MSC49_12950 [Methylosinus sp. C49]
MDERISPLTGRTLKRDVRPLELRYKESSVRIDMPGWYGEDDEDALHSGEDMKVSDRALCRLKARAEGLLQAEDIRRIRKKLGLTQKRASEIIGGGANAFQKYEAGDILVSRAMSNLLLLLDRQPDLLKVIEETGGEASAA